MVAPDIQNYISGKGLPHPISLRLTGEEFDLVNAALTRLHGAGVKCSRSRLLHLAIMEGLGIVLARIEPASPARRRRVQL